MVSTICYGEVESLAERSFALVFHQVVRSRGVAFRGLIGLRDLTDSSTLAERIPTKSLGFRVNWSS